MGRDEERAGGGAAPTARGHEPPPTARPAGGGGWWWRAAAALAVRPSLWGVALTQLLRLAVPGWWRRWPPLPAPDPAYLRFRLQTFYGDPAPPPAPRDVVAYLEWCREWERASR